MKYVQCNDCKWVHFQVSRKEATSNVRRFNAYYSKLSAKDKREFYKNSNAKLSAYKKCHGCGGSYKNFKTIAPELTPMGSTINPIMNKKD